MSDHIGYAVVEYNQASHRPHILDGSYTDDLSWAREIVTDEMAKTTSVGRREHYDVVGLTIVNEEETA